jgi:ketosteroid isomerase-like protein
MADAVRTQISPDARLPTRRTLDERIYVRWPGVYRRLARAADRLPPRSRLRRALVRRATLSSWATWARGDHESQLVRYAPDYRWEPLDEMVEVGVRSFYEGRAGAGEGAAELREAFDRIEAIPHEIIDGGDVVVVCGRLLMRARRSGIELEYYLACVYWADRGLIVRQRDFSDRDEALRAAGIPSAAASSSRRVTTAP